VIKLQRAGMEDATRGNISKLEARLIRVIDEDLLYFARVLGVEVIELYPESIRCACHLYEAIRKATASRFGLIFFTTLINCSQTAAGTARVLIAVAEGP
jgi:hypothetical protein